MKLNEREQLVFDKRQEGKLQREIAVELGISRSLVNLIEQQVYAKLGIKKVKSVKTINKLISFTDRDNNLIQGHADIFHKSNFTECLTSNALENILDKEK